MRNIFTRVIVISQDRFSMSLDFVNFKIKIKDEKVEYKVS